MKIIYGITKSNFGGAQRYVYELARAAKEGGHDVSVICGGPSFAEASAGKEGVLVEKLKNHGIKVFPIPHMQRDISLIDEFRSFHFIFRTLFKEKPDVFHSNSSKMGGIGNLAARFAGGKKIIFTGHGWAFKENRPWLEKIVIKFFAWLTILLSHKTICVSEQTRKDISIWPFIKDRLVVVKNGIEKFELFPRDKAREALGIGHEAFVVGVNSELHHIKGLDILLKAWQRFTKKNQVKLVIISDGEEKEKLEDLAAQLGISDSVTFKGYIDNARQYLLAFDIFCLPSRSENLPYAILEAGFAGLPVISTRVGGIPEIIETGINGILVEPENPEELFSGLLLLAENKDLRERLGTKLKETVNTKFTLSKMAKETLKVYSQYPGPRRVPPHA